MKHSTAGIALLIIAAATASLWMIGSYDGSKTRTDDENSDGSSQQGSKSDRWQNYARVKHEPSSKPSKVEHGSGSNGRLEGVTDAEPEGEIDEFEVLRQKRIAAFEESSEDPDVEFEFLQQQQAEMEETVFHRQMAEANEILASRQAEALQQLSVEAERDTYAEAAKAEQEMAHHMHMLEQEMAQHVHLLEQVRSAQKSIDEAQSVHFAAQEEIQKNHQELFATNSEISEKKLFLETIEADLERRQVKAQMRQAKSHVAILEIEAEISKLEMEDTVEPQEVSKNELAEAIPAEAKAKLLKDLDTQKQIDYHMRKQEDELRENGVKQFSEARESKDRLEEKRLYYSYLVEESERKGAYFAAELEHKIKEMETMEAMEAESERKVEQLRRNHDEILSQSAKMQHTQRQTVPRGNISRESAPTEEALRQIAKFEPRSDKVVFVTFNVNDWGLNNRKRKTTFKANPDNQIEKDIEAVFKETSQKNSRQCPGLIAIALQESWYSTTAITNVLTDAINNGYSDTDCGDYHMFYYHKKRPNELAMHIPFANPHGRTMIMVFKRKNDMGLYHGEMKANRSCRDESDAFQEKGTTMVKITLNKDDLRKKEKYCFMSSHFGTEPDSRYRCWKNVSVWPELKDCDHIFWGGDFNFRTPGMKPTNDNMDSMKVNDFNIRFGYKELDWYTSKNDTDLTYEGKLGALDEFHGISDGEENDQWYWLGSKKEWIHTCSLEGYAQGWKKGPHFDISVQSSRDGIDTHAKETVKIETYIPKNSRQEEKTIKVIGRLDDIDDERFKRSEASEKYGNPHYLPRYFTEGPKNPGQGFLPSFHPTSDPNMKGKMKDKQYVEKDDDELRKEGVLCINKYHENDPLKQRESKKICYKTEKNAKAKGARPPAWTDRVFYNGTPAFGIGDRGISGMVYEIVDNGYGVFSEPTSSDHFPVYAVFELEAESY